MIKTTKILTMMLVLMMGMSFASCDEFLGQADNPVTPAKTTITISSFKIVGTRTVSPGDVLVFGIDEKAQCVVTVDKKEYTLTGTVEDIPADLKPYIVTEWTSSDAQVATVDGKGTVTALAVGKTTIKLTVSAKDGSRQRSASYTLYVKDLDDPDDPYDPEHNPLTLEAIEDGTINVTFGDGLDLAKPITYTKNGVDYEGGTTDFYITVAAGDIVTFHSTNAALGKLVNSSYKHTTIKPTNRCYAYGNVMSLIDDEGDFTTDKVITGDYALYGLFWGAKKLENHPDKELFLPATTLDKYCYSYLFFACEALTKAPDLPATELKERCYDQMFSGCTSLTEAPVMSATKLAFGCCYCMFYGCTSLVKAPDLLATTLAENCYYDIFATCSSLNYVKCLATDVSATNCLKGWLFSTPATGTLEVASGATWAVAGTNDIPEGWTVTGKMPVTVSGYSGTYDGKAHGITATAPEDATVKYGTVEGTYTLTASPTYTDAGTHTVYYKVTMENYDPVSGSAEIKIAKAAGEIKFTQTSIEKKLGDSAFDSPLTMTNDPTATVTYSSDKPAVASVDANGRVSVNAGGTATITATVTSSTNYTYSPNYAKFTVKVTGMSDPDDYSNGGDPFGL